MPSTKQVERADRRSAVYGPINIHRNGGHVLFHITLLSALLAFISSSSAHAGTAGVLFTATAHAADQYAGDSSIDTSHPDARLFGFATEIHGSLVRTRFYDLSEAGRLTERVYSCATRPMACRRLPALPARTYAGAAQFSFVQLKSAYREVVSHVAGGGVDPAHVESTKVWQVGGRVFVNISYDVRAIEDTYVCLAASGGAGSFACELASELPPEEP